MKVLFRGDPVLINTYHALCRPADGSEVTQIAAQYIDFVQSEQGQIPIREYGKRLYGEAMYNDAAYAKQYDH